MTALAIAAVVLTGATLLLLLWPLLRRRWSAPDRSRFDLAVYRDQLEEVERDLRRGLLDAAEAEGARLEVKRRMLAAAERRDPPADDDEPAVSQAPPRRNRIAMLSIVLLLPLATAGLYGWLGTPGSPDRPLAARTAERAAAAAGEGQPASLQQAVEQLAKRLEANPADAGGWYLLGRAYLAMQRPPDAVTALRRAIALAPDELEVVAAYAEARLAAAGGRIDEETRDALRRMLTLDPASPQARFLLALDRAQQGDLAAAMQGWTDLIAMAPSDAEWLPTVRQHLQRAAETSGIDAGSLRPSAEALALADRLRELEGAHEGVPSGAAGAVTQDQDSEALAVGRGPGAADIAAADQMSPEDRAEMIRGMVDRLAARLEETPDDLDGWRRLARAYDVLGETAKAADARRRIAALEGR
jgi:cytochrome c-type biogenesis protein CcmH